MSTIDLTAGNFEQTVLDNEIVFVDFWASWCGPCRNFAPIYEAASEEHGDLVFASVNTEEEQQLASAARVTSIPTLMAFKKGALVFSQAGALPGEAVEDLIQQIRGLDMTEVRKQYEELKAKAEQQQS